MVCSFFSAASHFFPPQGPVLIPLYPGILSLQSHPELFFVPSRNKSSTHPGVRPGALGVWGAMLKFVSCWEDLHDLVMTNSLPWKITIFKWDNSLFLWPCSIAMFHYQRVIFGEHMMWKWFLNPAWGPSIFCENIKTLGSVGIKFWRGCCLVNDGIFNFNLGTW